MKKLSRLSKECIANNGLCCENRTPPIFLPSEIGLLLKSTSEHFVFGDCSAKPKSVCPFFKEPLCSVYQERPIDCRTYPVSTDLVKEKVIYIIDMKCPAVQKGAVSDSFIQQAIRTWKEKMPTKEWLEEYHTKEDGEKYEWVPIEDYKSYKRWLIKKLSNIIWS